MKPPSISVSKTKSYNLIFSLTLAVFLSIIPWEGLRSTEYYDRANNSSYIDLYLNKIHWFDYSSWLSKITYEWGWHYFLNFMTTTFGFNSTIILFLIAVFHLTVAIYLIVSIKKYHTALLLINPVYIDFFMSQNRLCFAITFIYLSLMLFNKKKILSLLLAAIALTIHTSTALFILIFYSGLYLSKSRFISSNYKIVITILIGLISAIVTGPYMSVILSAIDDRRADYSDMSPSLLFSLYWVLLFFYLIFKFLMNKIPYRNTFYFYISLSIVTLVFVNIFTSGYSSRFIAASFPLLALLISDYINRKEFLVVYAYIIATILHWFLWKV